MSCFASRFFLLVLLTVRRGEARQNLYSIVKYLSRTGGTSYRFYGREPTSIGYFSHRYDLRQTGVVSFKSVPSLERWGDATRALQRNLYRRDLHDASRPILILSGYFGPLLHSLSACT